MLFCLIAASRPNPTICLVRVSHASCSPTALSSSKDLPRRRSPSFVSARLEHGAGAVRSSQPALATPRAKQDHVQARRYGMAPKGPRVVPSQPARRVALPSSPTETLRLCEPYGMPTPTVPGVVSSVTILPLRAQAPTGQGRDTMSRRFHVVPSSSLIYFGADWRIENSRPHGVGFLLECLG